MYESIKTIIEYTHYDITESVNQHLKEGWELISTHIIEDRNEIGNIEFIYFYVMGLPKDNNKQ